MCQFTSLLTEHFDQSLDYFFGTSAGILSSFQASFYKEMDVRCDNRCKLDISHWGEDGETLIYIFHPDLNGNDIIALSYFAANLFVILVSYIPFTSKSSVVVILNIMVQPIWGKENWQLHCFLSPLDHC